MQDDIVGQGIELMLYGMGTVVVFLALLVVVTNVMSWLVARYAPAIEATVTAPVAPHSTVPHAELDPQLIAVISAAVHRRRLDRARSSQAAKS